MLDRILPALARRPVVAVVAAALVVAGCGGGTAAVYGGAGATTAASPSAAASTGQAYVVAVASDPALGSYLTGEDGMTLYVFRKDAPGTSACNGQCATSWPPFTLDAGESVSGGPGVTGSFATIARADGKTQVTYDGAPLYYFAGDAKPGDTTGQGLNGVWFVATPSGAQPSASPAASSSAGDGSGYDAYSRGGGAGSSPGAVPATGSPAPAATERATATPGVAATPRPTSTPRPAATPKPTSTPSPATTPKPTSSPAPAGASASIIDFGFAPATLTVRVGSTVTWTNTGSAPHTVTADDGTFGSQTLTHGATFSHAFATPGTYAYHCAIHSSMTGTVVVTK